MSLPRKNSRTTNVDGVEYRWLVTAPRSVMHLTIENDDCSGQRLQAIFEPHDQYKRNSTGDWEFSRQARQITPAVVGLVVRYAIANGWESTSRQRAPMILRSWQTDEIAPTPDEHCSGEVALRGLAIDEVADLRFDLSTDPGWRRLLFNSNVRQRHPISNDYYGLSRRIRDYGLTFAAFNDGWTTDGFVVFGIESVDFPDVVSYTTNNPDI